MRKNGNRLNQFRKEHPTLGKSPKNSLYGFFVIPPTTPGNHELSVISSGEHWDNPIGEWEHVSVSTPTRCPTWEEMCKVKNLFWYEHETVLQFHPKTSEYVNNFPYCLHLWKHKDEVKLPPTECV